MSRIVVQQWRDGQWLEPQTLFQTSPWATYAVWWSLGNVLVSLILLPAVAGCALRARGKVRRIVLPSGARVATATWSRRVAALLVDLLVIHLIGAAATVVLSVGDRGGAAAASLPAMVAIHTGVFFAYFVISEGLSGQSLGKRVLNIAVVGADGRRPPFGRVLLRNLLRPWLPLLPVVYLVGSIVLLLSPTSQRAGDMLAGTYVIDVPLPPPAPAAVG
jgi:uncharacterized RDD family membrane protein YckC